MRVTVRKTSKLILPIAALLALSAGCTHTYDWSDHYGSWLRYSSTPVPAGIERPELDMTDATVEAELSEQREDSARTGAALRTEMATVPRQTLRSAAAEVAHCYELGAREVAAELIAAHPQLFMWDQEGAPIEIGCNYRMRGRNGEIELSIKRTDADGPEELAVAFPPGTYGVAVGNGDPDEPPLADRGGRWTRPEQEKRFGHWPPAQDLALLRAPVLVLPAWAHSVKVRIPVSCASFQVGAPDADQPYRLDRFAKGSDIDRLMVELCAGPLPDDGEAQMAVWLCRDDISWEEFLKEGGAWGRLATFNGRRPVLPHHAKGAAHLMLKAGVDPRGVKFFGGQGTEERTLEPAEEREEPAQEREEKVEEREEAPAEERTEPKAGDLS